MKKALFFSCLLLLSSLLAAQNQTEANEQACLLGLQSITQADAQAYMNVLAADSLQGRSAGSEHGQKAADYIVQQLKAIGIPPLNNDYYQSFKINRHAPTRKGGKLTFVKRDIEFRNILGVIKGIDTSRYLVLGAHYDHVIFGFPSAQNTTDSIFNGADDNASGVTGVLQIAKALITSRKAPEVNIIIALWDGEEMGLVGSQHFVANCPYLDKIKGNVNLDMIGRNTKPEGEGYYVMYFHRDSVAKNWLETSIAHHSLNLSPDYLPIEKTPGGSDHLPFYQKGIPVIMYNTGLHTDLHAVTDEISKIDWDVMETVTKAAFLNVWKWAQALSEPDSQ